jgi:hypothetical protein
MRSIAHQTKSASFPPASDLTWFDFEVSGVDKALIHKLSDSSLTGDAQKRGAHWRAGHVQNPFGCGAGHI